MRSVQLRAYNGNPEGIAVADLPVPRPGPGQVLVRVAASPINPSDQMFLRGLYGFKKPLAAIPGFEGSGHKGADMPDVSYATVEKPSRSLLTSNSHLRRCSGSLRIDDTII